MLSIIGKEAQWVHESSIPLWLIKGYEEKLRKDLALADAMAAKQAAQGTSLQMMLVCHGAVSLLPGTGIGSYWIANKQNSRGTRSLKSPLQNAWSPAW